MAIFKNHQKKTVLFTCLAFLRDSDSKTFVSKEFPRDNLFYFKKYKLFPNKITLNGAKMKKISPSVAKIADLWEIPPISLKKVP